MIMCLCVTKDKSSPVYLYSTFHTQNTRDLTNTYLNRLLFAIGTTPGNMRIVKC